MDNDELNIIKFTENLVESIDKSVKKGVLNKTRVGSLRLQQRVRSIRSISSNRDVRDSYKDMRWSERETTSFSQFENSDGKMRNLDKRNKRRRGGNPVTEKWTSERDIKWRNVPVDSANRKSYSRVTKNMPPLKEVTRSSAVLVINYDGGPLYSTIIGRARIDVSLKNIGISETCIRRLQITY